mmetsp:Transcript_1325/g.2850  ORF Transcript_1325/g.2850 Transcript_1325/m.2850 type:complete len:655 (-) Transcript_1325:174-2138(-)|eukprot:CAMPEP_0172553072 /NCGR_PEP_ID=MMETSP1067-20121228/48294_1 /TAXON_ID=265564 ORGANISM="Thalassiosira punctigera, Strain Tpunct2005C2" /NCGR_SAMPLE_ID=MMETSP1067 /ASSEMBLY_ACC=CAM_ASM_000444 /LENGTH=654 /DNA_ID=CAMNT_0013341179 /DNA_START=60 /DNA_END=2024 /DNA_ORIENTATION=-
MNRAKSLLISESAFFSAAAASVSDQERHHNRSSSPRRGGLARRYSTFDLGSTSGDNEPIAEAARKFLSSACPELLAILENHYDEGSARDRLVKIGRSINATLRYGQATIERKNRGESAQMGVWSPDEEEEYIGSEVERKIKTDDILQRLVRECKDLAELLSSPAKVPTVRYGRTGIQMPIVTLGCMRFQQSWNRGGKPITTPEQLDAECQENLVRILKHAVHCGVHHVETAKGYGCSELQIGLALKTLFEEGVCKREDLIIQTKGGISSSTSKSDFKSQIVQQIKTLGLDYVDLFSVHGLNTNDHVEWLFNHGEKGNLIDAVRELKEEGKIRWIGFSTHAPAHVIRRAIETDAFDYLNLHYHFMGAYTASGDGCENGEGNLTNIRLAHEHDMGVFIISPYDKGGRLYTPSHLSRELTLPEMEPMEYGSSWLWHHENHCQCDGPAPIHTIVCGAARPSDLDQPVMAALRSLTDEAKEDFEVVSRRIDERKKFVLGKEWGATWHVGLPNYTQNERHGFQIGNMVWLYNAIHVYGMLDMAKDRYATLVNNSKKWDTKKALKENLAANPVFNWMPGCAYEPSHDYSSELKDVPAENKARVLVAMEFVHEWCCPEKSKLMALEAGADEKKEEDITKKVIPLEWQAAYDMRPWTAFPERG